MRNRNTTHQTALSEFFPNLPTVPTYPKFDPFWGKILVIWGKILVI